MGGIAGRVVPQRAGRACAVFLLGFMVVFRVDTPVGIIIAMEMEEPRPSRFRTDAEAHEYAVGAPISEVVRTLTDLLGATDVASIAGVGETRAVSQWMTGREPQHPHILRFALQVALMITNPEESETARAWFHASNPYLKDEQPIAMLRNRPLSEVQIPLLAAARAFAQRISNGKT